MEDTGGYSYCFVDQLHDRFICVICHLPSREPYMTGECCQGQTVCKSCLGLAVKMSNNCPICRSQNFVTHPNWHLTREIRNLHIYCTNKEKGCEWQGELNDINNHLGNSNGCQFEEVKCSNECGKMIKRRYLTSHVETECPRRKVNCQYCHDTGEHQFIEGQHKEECAKILLPCPNNCEVATVPREDLESHRKECSLEMIQCEYHNVGCDVMIARKDWERHKKENMEEHLMGTHQQLTVALRQIDHLTVMLNSLLTQPKNSNVANSISVVKWSIQLDASVAMCKSCDRKCPVMLKVSGKRKEWYSAPFYTHNKGYKMCLHVDATGIEGKNAHLAVYLFLMKGSYDDKLKWPLRGRFIVKIMNQISDSYHRSVAIYYDDNTPDENAGRVTEGDKAHGWGDDEFISIEDLFRTTRKCQFLVDDCVFFRVTRSC